MSAPIDRRYNDSKLLKSYMSEPTKAHVDMLDWLVQRYNFTQVQLPFLLSGQVILANKEPFHEYLSFQLEADLGVQS